MKKSLILVLIFCVALQPVLAIDVSIEQTSPSPVVMIPDLKSMPATFSIDIINSGSGGNFKIYNLIGFRMTPSGTFPVGVKQSLDVQIFPKEDLKERGLYIFDYYIQAEDGSEMSKKLYLNLVDIEDAFEVSSSIVDPESNEVKVFLENKVDFDFGEVDVKFTSPFFSIEETVDIEPNEVKSFTVKVDQNDFKELLAGVYKVNAEIIVDGVLANIEGDIKFAEKDIVTSSENHFGWVVNTNVLTKKNEGNVISEVNLEIKKNALSRLFTSFSPEPSSSERKGFVIEYLWQEELKPGEKLEVVTKTNWLYPFLLIFVVLAVVVIVKQFSTMPLMAHKKVNFVRTKGGEFALKVTLTLKANKRVERINVVDRLPALVQLHERFGAYAPSKIDQKNKRVEWEIGGLDAGEKRVLSYYVYSRIGILGTFALPSATVIYESMGKVYESISNRAFFVGEQRFGSEDEEY